MNFEIPISIVIRTFNSEKTLPGLLDNLRLTVGDEVVIVDSGSTDATTAIAKQHKATVVRPPGLFNYSKSLNCGFHLAKNAWVLVISSHCIPAASDFLAVYRREIVHFPAKVIVGFAPSTLSGKSDPVLNAHRTTFFTAADYKDVSRVCGNGNTIYRRSAWVELPFDETVRTAEDKLWIMEMIKRDYDFAYIPMARGLNKNQASLAYMYRKGYRDARALREPSHQPMKLWQLAGALRKLTLPKLRGEISWGNWARYGAHTLGQYFASYRSEDNTPKNGAS